MEGLILAIVVILICVFSFTIDFDKLTQRGGKSTQDVEDEPVQVTQYSDEELEETLDLHDYILENGTVPLSSVANAGTFVLSGLVGYVLGWVLYIPIVGILLLLNMGVEGAPLYDVEGGAGMGVFVLILDLVVVFFAIYGLAKMFDGTLGIDKNKDQLFEDYAKRMQAVIEKQKEEYDKLYESDIQVLNIKLENRDLEVKQLKEQLKTEIADRDKKLKEREEKYKHSLSLVNEEYKRASRLWALEKKELQYQLKVKQGLVEEIDDSQSPLGSLHNNQGE